jgi:C-terminal processing protease CtpA/Prc
MSPDDVVRVVACVIRRDASIDLGITFRQDVVNGCLVIDSIAGNGLFAHTGLRLDQQLVKINGHSCYRISKKNLDKTETILKQAKGIVTIEVQSPNPVISNEPTITERQIFTIQKATQTFQLGLGLEKIQTPEDSLRIVKLSATFQKVLGIKPGLQLVGINGSPCDVNDIDSVHEQMKQAFPLLTLECIATVMNQKEEEKEQQAEEKVQTLDENLRVVACIVRSDVDLDLGIAFRRDEENGHLIVSSVSKTGFFANTGLKPNLRVVKINGHRISKKRMDQAVELLQQAKGLITIEAQTSASKPSDESTVSERQIFSIQKATKSFQLGLGLEKIQTPDDTLRIVKVSPTFQKVLGLRQGLELLNINGTSCNVNDIDGVHKQMSEAFPMLTLECMATVVNKKPEEEDDEENIRVVACIVRPESNMDLGITCHADTEHGCLVIDTVSKDGYFAGTGLRVNQFIVKINGKRISQKNLTQAVELLKKARGRVTLETVSMKNPEANYERRFFSIQKTSENFQLGLGLGALQLPDESAPSLRILEVSQTFQKVLGLRPGLQLLKVNGSRCNMNDIPSVHSQMDHVFPMLSLECIATMIRKKKEEEKPAVEIKEISVAKEETKEEDKLRVVACIMRANASVDLGITFVKDFENGHLTIESLAADSPFASTGLQAGQKIVKINGKKTPKRKLEQAVESVQQAKGRITIEAESIATDARPTSERQIFSIQKASKSFQLGLGFSLEQTDSTPLLRIVKASQTLERVLGLKQGLQLLKINGVPCDTNDIQSIHAQMDAAFPILSLECFATFEPVEMRLHRVDSDLTEAVSAGGSAGGSGGSADGYISVEHDEEARLVAEAKAKAEDEARLKAEEEAKQKAEEEVRLAAEEKTREEEEARRKAEEETRLKAEEEATLKIEEEARIAAEEAEAARLKIEVEARIAVEEAEATRLKAEEEVRIAAEESQAARLKAEEETRLAAEAEASQLKAEAEAKAKAEEEAILKADAEAEAEEVARLEAEEKARVAGKEAEASRLKAEEEARLAAEAEAARLKAEEEANLKAEAEAKAKAEVEAQARAEEQARRKAEEEVKRKAEEEARLKAEAVAEVRRKEEEEARLKAEAEAKAKAEEEAILKAEEEARLKVEEDYRLKVEEAARHQAEQEAKEQAQEEARLKAYRESRLRVEEEARLWEEASNQAEEEANIAAAEEKKREERREKRLAASRESRKYDCARSIIV